MRNLKWQKPLIAVTLSMALAFPAQTVPAQGTQAQAEGVYTEEIQAEKMQAMEAQAEAAGGFEISENGTLVRYSGGATAVTIPKGVTSIGYEAFWGCENLSSVSIPEGVADIGEGAFRNCISLSSINIPKTVTRIQNQAFYGCSSLAGISIPEGVAEIGEGAFAACSSLAGIDVAKGNSNYSTYHGVLYNKDQSSLLQCPGSLSSLPIPDGVTKIGAYAFDSCGGLASLDIPDGVTEIGEHAFYNCSSLSSLDIPSGVASIGKYAFYGCSSLASLDIPDKVTSIGDGTFYGCSSLASLTIPDKVASIGDYVFDGCSSLASLTLPDRVTAIGKGAFWGCSSLTSLAIPDGVTEIKEYTFNHCSGLASLDIPDQVTSIGNSAFFECSGLASLTLPDQVTSIGRSAFERCRGLASLTIPDQVAAIGDSAFRDCSHLTSLAIPKRVTSIGDEVFRGCGGLIRLTIPQEVTSIKDSAFLECSSKLTIYGIPGSYAETYAKEKGILFSALSIPQPEIKEISACQIKLSPEIYPYDGKPKTPAVTVMDGKNRLTLGEDYTVKYEDNTNAGTAKAVITGTGSYQGRADAAFTIQKAAQSITAKKSYRKSYGDKAFSIHARLIRGDGKLSYTSSNKKIVSVNNTGKATLKGTGIATITVKASATANYNAESLKITIKATPARQAIISLACSKGRKLAIKWKKDAKASGYQIQYTTDKKFKKGVKTLTINKNKTPSKTTPTLKAGKPYYIKARSYKAVKINGRSQKLYGAWSKVKKGHKIK